jgi:hypothetical protein
MMLMNQDDEWKLLILHSCTVNRPRHKVKYDTQYDKCASSEGK